MRNFWRVTAAETYKQVRLYWGQPINVISEVVYPGLYFAVAYYMYRSFYSANTVPAWVPGGHGDALALFLLTGYLGYTIFQRLLWSALTLVWVERTNGSLEALYLTPASRFGLLIGASAGGMVRVVYLYAAFLITSTFFLSSWHIASGWMVLVAFVAVFVPGVAFGALADSFLLFARDSTAFVNVIAAPLNFFGGVRFPIQLLPGWMQVISAVLPLTWSLDVVRGALLEGQTLADVLPQFLLSMTVSAVCIVLAHWNMQRSERRAKERGTLVLY